MNAWCDGRTHGNSSRNPGIYDAIFRFVIKIGHDANQHVAGAGQHKRVTGGALRSSAFDIRVVNGKATGSVHATYSGLSIAMLDENESDAGISSKLPGFMAKTFESEARTSRINPVR